MMLGVRNWSNEKAKKLWERREDIYTGLIFLSVVFTIILMYYRAFFGTELTDEAYYVSEAKEMLNGNIPFAYNNSSKALGFTFLLIPIEALYKLFVPDFTGMFLFTRLCFVTYKVAIWSWVYSIFLRKLKKSHALLLSALLLPINGYLQNFSYNTIPELTMFLAGCLLYDVIEQDVTHKKVKLIVAGFMAGIACFANPGWAVALIVFIVLMLSYVRGKFEKIRILSYFSCAFFMQVFIVIVVISIRTSFSEFWYGFYRLFIDPIPTDPINPYKTWGGVIDSFRGPLKQWITFFVPVSIFTFIFSSKYVSEDGKKLSKKQYVLLSITSAMFLHLTYISYTNRGTTNLPYMWAFAAFGYMIVFMLTRIYREEKIIWYLGIYPLIYTVAEILFLSNNANIGRFTNAYTILIPILYVLLKNKSKLVRILAIILVSTLIVSLGYVDFHYIYRDENFHSLNYKVQSGVYKGIYTTKARSKDLPEFEKYLNSIIGEDETYAFRDNVPSAYLMVHKGKVCDISTWDILQHSYQRNSPAILFDYYRRRDMIPDKIIYVDFGRDANLSIIEPEYRYNDWVNEYYDLVEDIELNDTYFHVMVYQYNGTFDGDYQWWIDTYWELIK